MLACHAPSRLALISILSVSLGSGCAAVGNVLFAPHPASLEEPKGKLIAELGCRAGPEAFGLLASGVAVSAIVGFLKAESARYRATYSGAGTGDLRGAGCIEFKGDVFGKMKLELKPDGIANHVHGGSFEPRGVKSKVVAWPLRTLARGQNPFERQSWSGVVGTLVGFINPLMLGHAFWGLFDPGIYQVAYASTVRIETIAPNDQRPRVSLLALPLGKHSIDDIGAGTARTKDPLTTGYFPMPKGDGVPPSPLHTNVTVTITEANEVGDVIGQGAELVGENRRGFSDVLQGFFGLQ